jgi:hypothetical protein
MNSAVYVTKEVSSLFRWKKGDVVHLIELGGHVEVEDLGLALDLNGDKGVDLEVGKVKVDVDRVQAGNEVNEGLLDLTTGDVLEEAGLDGLAVGQLASDGDEKLDSLGVDISNLDSSLVGEENDISLTNRVDADVELGVGRVGKEGLDDEGVESTGGLLDLCIDEERIVSYRAEMAE